MPEPVCPKCAKKDIAVKQAKSDKGDLKYYQCGGCSAVWTNSIDIPKA